MATTVYLMFGPQGSGKSTQGERLAERQHIPYFDAGAGLRELAATDSDRGREVAKTMERGELVGNATLKSLFYDFMKTHNCENGLVADGFPRNEVQIELLDELARQHHWQIVGVFVDISDETAKHRLSHRKIVVDGKEVARDDDKPEIVAKRLETYRQETLPVIDWLKTHWRLLEIDGEPSVDEVTAAINKAIEAQHG